jgi:hypothetical protein
MKIIEATLKSHYILLFLYSSVVVVVILCCVDDGRLTRLFTSFWCVFLLNDNQFIIGLIVFIQSKSHRRHFCDFLYFYLCCCVKG